MIRKSSTISIAVTGALAAITLAMPPPALATNGYFQHGYGVKSQGIAGIGIALPQDGLAAATNPAGQAFVGDRVDLGLNWFVPKPWRRSRRQSGDRRQLRSQRDP